MALVDEVASDAALYHSDWDEDMKDAADDDFVAAFIPGQSVPDHQAERGRTQERTAHLIYANTIDLADLDVITRVKDSTKWQVVDVNDHAEGQRISVLKQFKITAKAHL